MSPLPPQKKKDGQNDNGRPQNGSWSFFLLMAMALGLLAVSHLGRMQAQQKLQAQVWTPKTAQGVAAAFEISASPTGVSITPPSFQVEDESTSATTRPSHRAVGLKMELLAHQAVAGGTVVMTFITDQPLGNLNTEVRGDGSVLVTAPDSSIDKPSKRQTCIVLVGTPLGLLNKLVIEGVDQQGLPVTPSNIKIEPNAQIAIYEFTNRGPGEFQFLQLTPKRDIPTSETIKTAQNSGILNSGEATP